MVKAVILAGSLAALSSAIPTQVNNLSARDAQVVGVLTVPAAPAPPKGLAGPKGPGPKGWAKGPKGPPPPKGWSPPPRPSDEYDEDWDGEYNDYDYDGESYDDDEYGYYKTKRSAEPQLGDLVDTAVGVTSDAISGVASFGGDVVSTGVDAVKDTAETLADAAKDILSIPFGILGLGYGYGDDDKKVKRTAEPQLGDLVDSAVGVTGDAISGVASFGGDVVSTGLDAVKDTTESLFDIGKDLLSIPLGILGLGYGYGEDDKKKLKMMMKRDPQLVGSILGGVSDIISDFTDTDRYRGYRGWGRGYRGYGRGYRYGRPSWSYGYDDDEDDDDYKKVKRTIIPDLLDGVTGTVDNVVDALFGGYGDDDESYGYGDYDKKAKRFLPDLLDIFGGDDDDESYGYGDYDRKAKRTIIPDILGGVTDTVDNVVDALFGGYGDDDESYGYGDYDKKAKRFLPDLLDIFGGDDDDESYGYGDYDRKALLKRNPQILSSLIDSLFGGWGSDDDEEDKPEAPEVEEVEVDVDALPAEAYPAAAPAAPAAPAFQPTW